MISSTRGPVARTVAKAAATRARHVASSSASAPAPTRVNAGGPSSLLSNCPTAGSSNRPAKSPLAPNTSNVPIEPATEALPRTIRITP